MLFRDFAHAVAAQLQSMIPMGLYHVPMKRDEDASVQEEENRPSPLWATYLTSFPAGANPLYNTRTEHDCSACRHFIRVLGSVVTIRDGSLVTLWDLTIGGAYQIVADAMAARVREAAQRDGIDNIFLHTERTVGIAKSRQLLPDQRVKEWEHFFVNLPLACVVAGTDRGTMCSEARATYDVMLRSLTELTMDAVETVLDLIAQNSLYRGTEQQFALESFRTLKRQFDAVQTEQERTFYCWAHYASAPPSVTRIRNTALGTLLVDLSEDKDLEDAVKAYERIMAPTNYQRPTALVTKAMIAQAQRTVEDLGLLSALERRYATLEDITVNNVLWADRTAKQAMGVFEQLAAEVRETDKTFEKVEEVPIEDFVTDILPRAQSLEVFAENRHAGNFVSLLAPGDPTAKRLFKWDNNFCWAYAGDMADSIRERVKRAGGNVEGDFRASLAWHNHDDLDLHLCEPGGFEIYYASARAPSRAPKTGGQLDVDMNAGHGHTRSPVENIVYPDRYRMTGGVYTLSVHNFCRRENADVGFEVELEFGGALHSFAYEKMVRDQERVQVAKFRYDHTDGLTLLESLPTTPVSRTLWGIPTQTFRKVTVVLLSPNYWNEKAVGNKHYFFMLEECVREGTARGFFNEYLRADLAPYRKVLEVVGTRMQTAESARQLSGLGFSSTQRNHVLCRVRGSFTRVVKVTL